MSKAIIEQKDKHGQRLTLHLELANGEPAQPMLYMKRLLKTQSLESWQKNLHVKIWGHSSGRPAMPESAPSLDHVKTAKAVRLYWDDVKVYGTEAQTLRALDCPTRVSAIKMPCRRSNSERF